MNGVKNHEEEGATKTRELLTPYCSDYELNEICEIIRAHDDRDHPKDYSRYIQLHQDADLLDHFGVFDIWRTFLYAVPHDQTILDIVDWMTTNRPVENEKYRQKLNFEVSKRIFDEKMDFVNSFTDRFSVECAGDIWDGERLLSR
jgi:uncharacterized protein